MKKFEQKFSDADYDKVVNAFSEDYNYQDKIDVTVDGVTTKQDNTETREQFADRIIFEFIERQTFVNNKKKGDKVAVEARTQTGKVKRVTTNFLGL